MSSEAEARGDGAGAGGGDADVIGGLLDWGCHASASADGSGYPDGSLGRPPAGRSGEERKAIGQHRRHVHRLLLLLVIGR